MGTIIKLLIAALLLNAAAQAGMATFRNYQFQDAVQQVVQFAGSNATDNEIVQRILRVAEEQDIPIGASDVSITHLRQELKVTIPYAKDVMLVPGVYTLNWTFTSKASVLVLPTRQ